MANSSDLHSENPAPSGLVVRRVVHRDLPAVRAFLEGYLDTSIYLLSNLTTLGISATASPMSGNFLLVEEGGRLIGVSCLARRGDLLAQTGGRPDLAAPILEACAGEGIPVAGVLAEWGLAEALWDQVSRERAFRSLYRSKSVVYRLDRAIAVPHVDDAFVVRALSARDFDAWEPVDRAFHEEEGLAVSTDVERRLRAYRMRADAGGWWGAFAGGALVSTACVHASYRGVGQVGGVYTQPPFRRRGLARRVMAELMRDQDRRNGLRALVLFAAESNHIARAMYASMGFAERGYFGLLFGRRDDDGRVAVEGRGLG